MHRTSPATLLATLTACLTGMLLLATPANAGVATIYQCRTPTGVADTDLADASGSSALVLSLGDCNSGGAWIVSSGSAGVNEPAAVKTLTFRAPGGTRFVGGTLYRQMNNYAYVSIGSPTLDSWGFGYALTNAQSEVLERCGYGQGAPALGQCGPAWSSVGASDYTRFGTGSTALPMSNTTAYNLSVGCATSDRCYHHHANPGLIDVRATFKVEDPAAPTDVVVSGPLATADPIGPAATVLNLSASDPDGLGVYRAQFLVDGQKVDEGVFTDNGGKCVDVDPANGNPYEFASGHPCPLVAPTKTFEPANLPEGAHNLRVRVEDAAGNSVVALDRNVTIDLIAAPTSTSAPQVSGTAESGRSLMADPGTWDVHGGPAVSFAYAWERCDAAGVSCSPVTGAGSALYDLGAADVGRRLRATVTATNSEGATHATSAMTPVVAASPNDTGTAPTGSGGSGSTGTNGGGAGLPGVQDTLGPDLRPAGAPNGLNATEKVTLSAFESTTERRHVRIRFGRPLAVSGRLVAPGGLPVAGARLEVLTKQRRPGAAMAHQVDILTGADGRFTYLAPAGPSRTIRIGYRSRVGDVTFARTTDVDVRVVASVAFRLSRKRLRNGQTLRYVGRLRGPGTSHRFVEVQVRNGRSWQIVCSVRTDSKGAFACAHRFRRTYRTTTYAFRARVRRQSGLAYEAGASALRRARVRP